jgi:LPS-assembly protein
MAPGSQMLVEADQLVYDYDHNTVSAVGNVKIYYAGYTLQSEKVAYNKKTGRLVASGNVKLTDPSGANFYAENFDITDDFRDGFVQSLRVDTPDRTHFAAESAQRSGGETTTFTNGVYTACEPCIEHPEKPPLWNVKAAKIVVDHKAQMVYFTDAQMEFFGLPVAYFPYFGIPDPSVKRKSGLLMPNAGYSAHVGAFLSVPYYWAPAPNYDVTFTPTVYSRQGLMGAVEWRHRVDNGQYTLKGAGIYQLDPGAFADKPGDRRFRGSLRTTGEFYINKDWTFGWDGTLSSDRTFTRDYDIINTDTSETISTAHLTGINGRNFFEARASYYQILTDPDFAPASHPGQYDQSRQAWTAPVIDYHRIASDQVLGGELSFTTNIANVVRQDDDQFDIDPPTADWRFAGTAGTTVRATQEVDWQRRIIGPMGQVIVPFASLRGDAFFMGGQSADAIAQGLTPDDSAFRFMPAVGVDWSLPILATAGGSTHIFEPRSRSSRGPTRWTAARGRTTMRRASCSTIRTSSITTSSPVTTGSKAARAPTSASTTTAASPTAPASTAHSASRSSLPAPIPLRPTRFPTSAPIPALRPSIPTTSAASPSTAASDRASVRAAASTRLTSI